MTDFIQFAYHNDLRIYKTKNTVKMTYFKQHIGHIGTVFIILGYFKVLLIVQLNCECYICKKH
jgi:hypothetical protein